jgi:hypothetical protein
MPLERVVSKELEEGGWSEEEAPFFSRQITHLMFCGVLELEDFTRCSQRSHSHFSFFDLFRLKGMRAKKGSKSGKQREQRLLTIGPETAIAGTVHTDSTLGAFGRTQIWQVLKHRTSINKRKQKEAGRMVVNATRKHTEQSTPSITAKRLVVVNSTVFDDMWRRMMTLFVLT